MENEKLKESYMDERTNIEYRRVGDYYIPNLTMKQEEKITLNKYGRLRLKYLKEHKKAEYIIMFIDGVLNKHLKETQETAQNRVDLIIDFDYSFDYNKLVSVLKSYLHFILIPL